MGQRVWCLPPRVTQVHRNWTLNQTTDSSLLDQFESIVYMTKHVLLVDRKRTDSSIVNWRCTNYILVMFNMLTPYRGTLCAIIWALYTSNFKVVTNNIPYGKVFISKQYSIGKDLDYARERPCSEIIFAIQYCIERISDLVWNLLFIVVTVST